MKPDSVQGQNFYHRPFSDPVGVSVPRDVEGKKITGTAVQSCKARQGKLRCIFDNVHATLGGSHAHRNEDGSLTYWREAQNAQEAPE